MFTIPETSTIADKLIDHRRLLVSLVILISACLAPFAARIELDRTLKSAYVTSSECFADYKKFTRAFGTDEFVLVAIKGNDGAGDPVLLKALTTITAKLEAYPKTKQVLSLANLQVFQNKDGVFADDGLVVENEGKLSLQDPHRVERVREALPLLNYLLSRDGKTVGIVVRIAEKWRFDPSMPRILKDILGIVRADLPSGVDTRILGAFVLREAVQNNVVQTALITLVGGALIGALVALYIFKSLNVALITMFVLNGSVLWVAGIMAIAGIPLNSTTALSFGLVLIVSVVNVIHIVSRYYEASGRLDDKEEAVRQGLRAVFRPCLVCGLTTSAAFATIMVSSMPMVKQLGFVMSLGVMIAFVLAMILTPACLMLAKPVDSRTRERMRNDWVAWIFARVEAFVFKRYVLCVTLGIAFTVAMIAGTPLVRVDTQLLNLFVKSSQELADIHFVERNLTSVHALEVMVEADKPQSFKMPVLWQGVRELEKGLKAHPEVIEVDSGLHLFDYVYELVAKEGKDRPDLLSDPALLSQVMLVIGFNKEGRRLLPRYLDEDRTRTRITVKIRNSPEATIGETIQAVKGEANRVFKDKANVYVTGELAVFADQVSDVVRSMFLSLLLAFVCITLLLMIQMQSWTLGLLSLVPNILPAMSVFGLMGWLGIPLDGVTIFAATIAIGLSVDDTIHYLTQLKLVLSSTDVGRTGIEEPLKTAYRKTAKALISTSMTLFFGVLIICLTPTRPAGYFGFLGSIAIVVALLGDIVFLPALILSSSFVRKLLIRSV